MRIKLIFTANKELVPRNLNTLTSWLHNVLGRNNKFHDANTPFSISPMLGGTFVNKHFETFKNGGYIYISTNNMEVFETIVNNVHNFSFGYGMDYDHFLFVNDLNMNKQIKTMFFRTVKTGLVVKKNNGQKNEYLDFEQEDFMTYLKQKTLKRIMALDDTISVKDFDMTLVDSSNNKIKNLILKNNKIKSNDITIKVIGNYKIFKLLYEYGLGNSNGCGFGMLYPTNQWREYLSY